jgi:dihydroxyacetone kinase phosphotransfer subunit
MKRGAMAILERVDDLAAQSLPDALKTAGQTLVMKVGGASGPLYGTLLMTLGKELPAAPTQGDVVRALGVAVAAVKKIGRSDLGQKTMLDVLGPVHAELALSGTRAPGPRTTARCRSRRVHRTDEGSERSRIVPGRSLDRPYGSRCAIVDADDCRRVHRDGGMNVANVGIVIVSHSPKIAEGAADMVRQMVGDSVPLAWTGGNSEGELGTDVASIIAAIERAWSDAGVAVLVDLGGAETNSEMAIDMLEAGRGEKVVVCEAPVVEGAVMAATEASGGATLDAVRRTAEELSPT